MGHSNIIIKLNFFVSCSACFISINQKFYTNFMAEGMAQWLSSENVAENSSQIKEKEVWMNLITNTAWHGTI